MRTFLLEQSNKEITSHAGISLIGACINKFTSLTRAIDAALPKRHGTPTSDMVKTFLGLMSQGKNDFESINNVRNDDFFHQALDLQKRIPTEASIRLRFEDEAKALTPMIEQCNVEFMVNRGISITPLHTGHIPLDMDVTPHDNSNTKKELVSFTYKMMDGYSPIASYLGQEGWCVGYELRAGKQHSQCGFIPALERTFNAVHQILEPQAKTSQIVMLRLDSAHDAKENRAWLYDFDTPLWVDYIIKWNPRREASAENKQKWWNYAEQLGLHAEWETPREGKRVVTFSMYVDEEYKGKIYSTRLIIRL